MFDIVIIYYFLKFVNFIRVFILILLCLEYIFIVVGIYLWYMLYKEVGI